MTDKNIKQKLYAVIGVADAEAHARLRQILSDHQPATYGKLRREHGLSPVFLETQIAKYPEVFEGPTERTSGKPMIRLKDGVLESREDILMRRTLVKRIRQAGICGIRLQRLYTGTRIASKEVQRLSDGADNIAASVKGRDILYRWIGEPNNSGKPEKFRIRDSSPAGPLPEPVGEGAELEAAKSKLVALCEKTHRHVDLWLSQFMDVALIKRVLAAYPDDFEVTSCDLGNPDTVVRVKRFAAAAMPAPPAAADASSSAPQDGGPPDRLEEIFDPATLAQLKFKPPSQHMASRRNGRVITKDQRQRERYPLIQI